MSHPKHPACAIVAAQRAVSHALNHGKIDPFSETFSKLTTAFAFLFDKPINDVRAIFQGPAIGCEDVEDIETEVFAAAGEGSNPDADAKGGK